jgi:hypothetical protein
VNATHPFGLSAARRRASIVVLALLPLATVAACSSDDDSWPIGPGGAASPTPPSGVANVSGNWSGTSDWEQTDVHTIATVAMAIEQQDRAVTGTLTFTSTAYRGWSGTIEGTVAGRAPDTQFVGTIEVRSPATTGSGACIGSAVFSGRSVSDSLRWDTTQLTVASNTDGQRASACRGALRHVVLILGRG